MEPRYRHPGLTDALPFWASLALVPVALFAAERGGLAIFLVPMSTWGLFAALDAAVGKERSAIDPETGTAALGWYMAITRLWPVVQIALLLWLLWRVPGAAHLSAGEQAGVFAALGVLTGTVGIVYAHELMHRPGRGDRFLGDLLMTSVLYGHFRSEHLLVHHIHVATPRDAVTARYGETFPAFFARVLPGCLRSAWSAEAAMLRRKGQGALALTNPFWRYGAMQAGFLALAWALAGGWGALLFAIQALVAILQLELVNYVEHYGLTRRQLPNGGYEPVRPWHSWNANEKASNRLLINLQRHSDHHTKPARPFPLLQPGDPAEAPELPYGYPVMTTAALIPPLWRRLMNRRVRAWRKRYYPEVTDWA